MTHHVASIVGGDTNLVFTAREDLARAMDAEVSSNGVDALFAIDATITSKHVLAEGGSDHAPILWTLDVAGHEVKVLDWNVYVGQRPTRVRRRLARLIRRHRPDVVLLQEAYRCRGQLARLSESKRRPYHHFQGANVGEGADCALLVRGDHHVVRSGTMRMRTGWRGLAKHGRPLRSPREYPFARVRIAPGVVLRAMSIHFPTGGGNETAADESTRSATRWATRGHRP